MTPEREKYHELLAEFAASLPDGALVYDIGRTHAHEYSEWFPRQTYKSIDRNPKAEPDILCDMEGRFLNLPSCDALLCNGVTESAADPFRLVRGCWEVLKPGGFAMFGIRLTGYPLSENHDCTRFTAPGALRLLRQNGYEFEIRNSHCVFRAGAPSYFFAVGTR